MSNDIRRWTIGPVIFRLRQRGVAAGFMIGSEGLQRKIDERSTWRLEVHLLFGLPFRFSLLLKRLGGALGGMLDLGLVGMTFVWWSLRRYRRFGHEHDTKELLRFGRKRAAQEREQSIRGEEDAT